MTSGIFRLGFFSQKKNIREDEMLGLFLSMLDVRVRSIEPDNPRRAGQRDGVGDEV